MIWTPISKCYVTVEAKGQKFLAGVLSENDGEFRFAYGQSWLKSPQSFPFDPVNLPLSSKTYQSEHLWGAFADSLPDNWGKRVMLALHSQKPSNNIEWLLATRGAGVGALTYSASLNHPPVIASIPTYHDLEAILDLIKNIEIGQFPRDIDSNLLKLVEFGSSMGGARPKVTIAKDGTHYLAKLSRNDDSYDQLRAEHACLMMANEIGIPTPGSHIEEINGVPVLFIKRFDFDEEGGRRHYLSARSVIAAFRIREGLNSPASYLRIASDISRMSASPREDRIDLFKRMVLNVMIRNTDDHLQNHGWLVEQDNPSRYRLSPCFDILPHPASPEVMALNIGKEGRKASLSNALSSADQFGLTKDEAVSIMQEIGAVVANCESFFTEAGMNPLDIQIMTSACTRLIPELKTL